MTPATTTTAESRLEPVGPHPRRYWWLKRLALLFVLVVATVAGVRWWWGTVAERRMTAMIDAAHARGQKILVGDYARADWLPDERNSAFYLNRAGKALKLSTAEDWAITNAIDLPLRQDVFDLTGRVLADQRKVLADIRTARRQEQSDWGVNVFSPMWSVLLPHLNPARQLANLSRAAAIHAAQRGDHAEAVEHVRDLAAIGASLDDGNTFLITHLVRVGVESMAADAAAEIALDLAVAGEGATRPGSAASPASRQQVRELIELLLDDGPRRASVQKAFQGERAMHVDIGTMVARRARVVRPAIQMDALGLAREGEQLMQAAAAPTWPAARKLMPVPPRINGPRVAAHVISESIRPAVNRTVLTTMRASAQDRLAAVALAIRLYQLDHGGQRPPTLAALVPAYLPAVPADPFAAAAKEIGYAAAGPAPYVYSVGENGRDDSTGSPPWRPDETTPDPLRAPDLFVHLTREHAPPRKVDDPPAPETDDVPATATAP